MKHTAKKLISELTAICSICKRKVKYLDLEEDNVTIETGERIAICKKCYFEK
jgi:hypothetical protein